MSDREKVVRELVANMATKDELVMLNVEFLRNEDLGQMPRVVDWLLQREGVETAVVYGVKEDGVYLVAKSRRQQSLREMLRRAFPGLSMVRDADGYTLAVIPLGALGYFHSQRKVLNIVDELMNEALAGGAARRGGAAVFERIAGIKDMISVDEKQGVACQ